MAQEGVSNQISIGVQSAFGSDATPTVSIPIRPSDGMNARQDTIELEAINTKPAKAKCLAAGVRTFEGAFDLNAYPNAIGYFLLSALGAVDTNQVGASDAYTHDFTESVAKTPLTIEQKDGVVTKRYVDSVAGGFKISSKVGEAVVFSSPIVAKSKMDDETAIASAYESSCPFNWAHFTYVKIGGVDIKAHVQDIEVEYANEASVFHALGDVNPAGSYVKQSTAKGKMTMYLDDDTKAYLDSLIDGTEAEFTFQLQGDEIDSASSEGLIVTLPKTKFTKVETKLDFDVNMVTVEFEGREDATDGLITAQLTNTTTSYAAV